MTNETEKPQVIESDLSPIRKRLRDVARKSRRDEEHESHALLSSLIDGKSLAMSPVERENWKRAYPKAPEPIGRDYAVNKTASLVAINLLEPTPWAPLICELFRTSIQAMDTQDCDCLHEDPCLHDDKDYWLKEAEDCYERALARRVENDRAREKVAATARDQHDARVKASLEASRPEREAFLRHLNSSEEGAINAVGSFEAELYLAVIKLLNQKFNEGSSTSSFGTKLKTAHHCTARKISAASRDAVLAAIVDESQQRAASLATSYDIRNLS